MPESLNIAPPEQPHILRELGLSREALEALRRQGFVTGEFCVRGGRRLGPYFKLRWRSAGRQRVVYLGADARRAEAVRGALARWQQPRRLQRDVDRLLAQTRRALRAVKQTVTPHLETPDTHWHGYQLRRRRQPAPCPQPTSSSTSITENDHD